MTFLPHEKLQAAKVTYKLPRTAQLRYGVQPQAMAKIYKAVYDPIVFYAAEAWVHRIQNTHIKRALRTGQRQVVLSITGAYRTTSFLALTVAVGVMTIDLKIIEFMESQKLKRNERP